MRLHSLAASLALTFAACLLGPPAFAEPRRFVSSHTAMIGGETVPYQASVEEYLIAGRSGKPELSLFATAYVRTGVADAARRPVVFIFNGGPSAAAIGLHMQFGPEDQARSQGKSPPDSPPKFVNNPESLLDVADLVMFDPAETGFSRMLPGGDRSWFYSTGGDADSLARLVVAWRRAHGREHSPLYLLGESYGSIRQVVAADVLAKRGVHVDGQIIFGCSIFLMETSRRTHNIVSTAVSLPMLAATAAYHGKADTHGRSVADFVHEVYAFAMQDYLSALAQGYSIGDADKRRMAERLAAYTGISSEYFMAHDLTVAKQDFNHLLLPGKQLDANDTRIARSVAPAKKPRAQPQSPADPYAGIGKLYGDYMHSELGVRLPGVQYRAMAPDSFDGWDFGSGCNKYLESADLCNPKSDKRSVFVDYDWPEVLKREFADPRFKTMIVAGYYDGLSSIGTQFYLAAQLGYPKSRFAIHAYASGHATAEDPKVRPQVAADVRSFITAP